MHCLVFVHSVHVLHFFRFLSFAAAMQIFVRTLDDRTLTLDVQSEDTVNDVKELVEQREGRFETAHTRLARSVIALDPF